MNPQQPDDVSGTIVNVVRRPHRPYRVAGGIILGLALAIAVVFKVGHSPSNGEGQNTSHNDASRDHVSGHSIASVKVVHPKLNEQELVRSITQPAFIEGLTQADLMSRVAGVVKSINKNIGDSIVKGDVLIEIEAPDLAKTIEQKAALVEHARQELRSAESNVKVMEAAEKSAVSIIAEKEADVDRFEAKKRYLDAELVRFNTLAKKDAVLANIVDEKKLEAESAAAALKSARAAVGTAHSESERAAAKLDEAKIAVDVKKSSVAVAQSDQEQAEAQFDFTKIRAPFDGTVIGRNVDPGAFVQNASTGKPTALLSVVQLETVTAVMWVPEREAPFVSKNTAAVLKLDALNGKELKAKVDRVSNWLDPDHSRDMRIEIDIKNPTGKSGSPPPIRPGMYGSMTLMLQRFDKAYLLPVSAVFQRDKKTSMIEVSDGMAHIVPVHVEFEDGAKIIVSKLNGYGTTGKDAYSKLTGGEFIVSSGQGEIADGEKVNTVEITW